MSSVFELDWLPSIEDWKNRLNSLGEASDLDTAWPEFVSLANTRMDLVLSGQLERLLIRTYALSGPPASAIETVRLAVLGSATTSHLARGMRLAALRRGMWLEYYESSFGQFRQELTDAKSALHAFAPTDVLFAFDAEFLARRFHVGDGKEQFDDTCRDVLAEIASFWRAAREAFGCRLYQQTAIPRFAPLLGGNEHRLLGSPQQAITGINARLRSASDEFDVDLVAIDAHLAHDGMARWHDPVFWRSAKQEISLVAASLYGDLVLRLVAARRGRSAKCLAVDLDNTLWGGAIGDDGLEGIELGQGSAAGESFVAFQHYLRNLSRRGVILSVCSKNDEALARAAFEKHPEMVLKMGDIACFLANWRDKDMNIREIAGRLNIGLNSIVFFDDSPFERNIIRRLLPDVLVPEVPQEPDQYAQTLANAGYFEGVGVTQEDWGRTRAYQDNQQRALLARDASDVAAYLHDLRMQLVWGRFDKVSLKRIVQLANKTNQFNLTTVRYTEDEARALIDDQNAFALHFRLLDRFGDNGIISLVVGHLRDDGDITLETWLMSCRVLGRRVEEAVLDIIVDQARRRGARRLHGAYRPTGRNELVREHYDGLGFTLVNADERGTRLYTLDLDGYAHTDLGLQVDAVAQ